MTLLIHNYHKYMKKVDFIAQRIHEIKSLLEVNHCLQYYDTHKRSTCGKRYLK